MAAAKDEPTAMTNLGVLFASGEGVPQDYTKAREWLEKAAAKGDEDAKQNLVKLSISEATTSGRYAEALQLQEALAAKVETMETKRDGKPRRADRDGDPRSGVVRPVCTGIPESFGGQRSRPHAPSAQPLNRNQPGARTHVHRSR